MVWLPQDVHDMTLMKSLPPRKRKRVSETGIHTIQLNPHEVAVFTTGTTTIYDMKVQLNVVNVKSDYVLHLGMTIFLASRNIIHKKIIVGGFPRQIIAGGAVS